MGSFDSETLFSRFWGFGPCKGQTNKGGYPKLTSAHGRQAQCCVRGAFPGSFSVFSISKRESDTYQNGLGYISDTYPNPYPPVSVPPLMTTLNEFPISDFFYWSISACLDDRFSERLLRHTLGVAPLKLQWSPCLRCGIVFQLQPTLPGSDFRVP